MSQGYLLDIQALYNGCAVGLILCYSVELFHRSHADVKLQVAITGAVNKGIISRTCDCSAIAQNGCCAEGLCLW